MLVRLAILMTTLTCGWLPAAALASSRDATTTHAYLTASYTVLHTTVDEWPTIEANIRRLDRQLHGECPDAGAGSPQNEPAQKLTYEVAGAIWSTAYRTNAKVVQRFARTIEPLHWSKGSITKISRSYAASLHALTVLPMPDLCGDVRTWDSGGFKAIPQSTLAFDHHVEAIEGKAIPLHLLAPYEDAADRSLAARVGRLETRFEHLETERGFEDWNTLLETLGLNQ